MEKELNTHEKKLLESFKKWNYEYKTDLTAPIIFEQMYINLVKNIAKDELGDTLFREFMGRRIIVRNFIRKIFNSEGNPWIDDVTSKKKETLTDIIVKSYRKTVEEIAEMADENLSQISWGDQHTISFKHPLSQKKILDRAFNLNRGPFKVGGSYHTVRPYSYSYNNPYNANHGASQRHIYNTANWDESFSVIPTGNSGLPASNFYCNQTQMYIKDSYHRDLFTFPEIKKKYKYKMKITKN
jgi:penicillin amidase